MHTTIIIITTTFIRDCNARLSFSVTHSYMQHALLLVCYKAGSPPLTSKSSAGYITFNRTLQLQPGISLGRLSH